MQNIVLVMMMMIDESGEGDIDAIGIAPTVNKESELKHAKQQGQEVEYNEVHQNFHHWCVPFNREFHQSKLLFSIRQEMEVQLC